MERAGKGSGLTEEEGDASKHSTDFNKFSTAVPEEEDEEGRSSSKVPFPPSVARLLFFILPHPAMRQE